MSGGSYNYLYLKEPDELAASADFDRMMERAAGLPYAQDFALELERMETIRRLYLIRMRVAMENLQGPMHALEWWDSCDYGEDDFKDALDEWRNK